MRKTLAVLSCIVSLAAALDAERLPMRHFTIADGLPHDYVSSILCDSRGFLWFATREGLARFDGSRFTLLDNVPLLAGARVRDIVERPNGIYWIATNRGLLQFRPGADVEFRRVSVPPNVFGVAPGSNNSIWAATDRGLFHVSGDRVSLAATPGWVNAVLEDHAVLWFGTPHGLYRRGEDGTATHYTVREGLPGDDVRSIAVAGDGSLWVGTSMGACRFRGTPANGLEKFHKADGLPSEYITAMLSARDGSVWIGTDSGVARADSSHGRIRFRAITSAHGLSDRAVFTLAEDHDGGVWLGTESSGVFVIGRSGFTSFSEDDGLASGRIAAIGEDRTGNLFVVSSGDVLHTFDGSQFHAVHPHLPPSIDNTGWGWNQIALQASSGAWWLATGRGLCRYGQVHAITDLAQINPRVYTAADGMPADDIFRVFEDARHNLWVSVIEDKHPLVRMDHATAAIHAFGVSDGMPGDRAPSMFTEDRAGNLWIGFYFGGMLRMRKGRFETVAAIPEGTIRDMHIDHAGRLWVATESGGAVRIDDPAADVPVVHLYTKENGLSTNQIYSIAEDRYGRIYLGTSRGISRVDPDTGHVKRFSTADGLPNNLINVAFTDRSGALWFGSLQGIARLVPEQDEPRTPPPVWISGLRVAGIPHLLSAIGMRSIGPLELAPAQNRVDIDFESVSLRPGEALRYQYRLAAERKWSAAAPQPSVALANLAPGSYRFEVRAVSSDGIASSIPALVRFEVLPPIWHRWWFMLSFAIALAAAIHLYYRDRARQLLELERVRVRIASDLHDDIGANLSRIVVLSEVVKREVENPRSSRMLADVADSARGAVESMSDIVWSIDPRQDDVESLNRRLRQCAGEILDPAGIRWTFDGDSHAERLKLGPAHRRHIHLIVKEALTNAVRHSRCRHAAIAIRATDRALHIDISDDGEGFDPAIAGQGHGLRNMRSRVAEIGADVAVDTKRGGGTRVSLSLPFRGASMIMRLR